MAKVIGGRATCVPVISTGQSGGRLLPRTSTLDWRAVRMGKKGHGKAHAAAKGGSLKLDKFTRDTSSAKSKLPKGTAPASLTTRKQDHAKSSNYDEQLMELAERQFGKSKAASAHMRPAKPLVVAPPTLILPQMQPAAFEEIDKLLHGEQAPLPAVTESKKRATPSAVSSRGMFSGLSDSDEDEGEAKAPSFHVAPATFVWQPNS